MLIALLLLAASDELPAVIAYDAPPECVSSEAFLAEVQAQAAQMHALHQARRFVVQIRHDKDFVGSITTSSGAREIHAASCAEVSSALAVIVAMAIPEVTRDEMEAVSQPEAPPKIVISRVTAPPPTWRLGLRFQALYGSTDGQLTAAHGSALVASIEPHWGRYSMLFELSATFAYRKQMVSVPILSCPLYLVCTSARASHMDSLLTVDAQLCPLDFALGHFGLTVLACTRVSIGEDWGSASNYDPSSFSDFNLWFGANARLRWQSPKRVYVEAHFGGVAGIPSSADAFSVSPPYLDWGATVGTTL